MLIILLLKSTHTSSSLEASKQASSICKRREEKRREEEKRRREEKRKRREEKKRREEEKRREEKRRDLFLSRSR